MNAGRKRDRIGGLVPFQQNVLSFVRREQREIAKTALRILDEFPQKHLDLSQHATDGRVLKNSGIVEQPQV